MKPQFNDSNRPAKRDITVGSIAGIDDRVEASDFDAIRKTRIYRAGIWGHRTVLLGLLWMGVCGYAGWTRLLGYGVAAVLIGAGLILAYGFWAVTLPRAATRLSKLAVTTWRDIFLPKSR